MKTEEKQVREIIQNLYDQKKVLRNSRANAEKNIVSLFFQMNTDIEDDIVKLTDFDDVICNGNNQYITNRVTLLSNWVDEDEAEPERVKIAEIHLDKGSNSIEQLVLQNNNGDTFIGFPAELAEDDTETIFELISSKT